MGCCGTFGHAAEHQFDQKKAAEELARYRRNGPGETARLLLDGIQRWAPAGGSLLDVGSGIGSLTFALLERGAPRAIAVDASSAYLAAAAEEADRRGRVGAIRFVHGDFVELAHRLPPATLVTLDRVVCCYPSVEPLLEAAIGHAERCLALSYPRDVWYVRAVLALENAGRRLKGNPFRTFAHSTTRMHQLVEQAGFDLVSRSGTLAWCADVYRRKG